MTTKIRFNQIQGGEVNVFDFMSATEIADVQAGTAQVNVAAAIQAAIDSIPMGTVRFPEGIYRIESTLTVALNASTKLSIDLRGSGVLGCQIQWHGAVNSSMIHIYNTASGTGSSMWSVEGIKLYNSIAISDTTLYGIIGIEIGATQVNGVTTTGVNGACNGTVRKCQIYRCDTSLHYWSESDQQRIEDNYLVTYTTSAIIATAVASIVSGSGSATFNISGNVINGGASGSIAINYKGSGLAIIGNTIQPSAGGSGILLQDCRGFTIQSNYSEVAGSTSLYWVRAASSGSGYIGQNEIGGYGNAPLIWIDNASRDINIGPNFHTGLAATEQVKIESGARGIHIIGRQFSGSSAWVDDGYTNDITGVMDFQLTGAGQAVSPAVNSYGTYASVALSSYLEILTPAVGGYYLVMAYQLENGYTASALVTYPSGATPSNIVIVDLGTSSVLNFSLTKNLGASSQAVIRANNLIAVAKTIDWTYIRLR